ncbi:MAG: tetratricopeptide repeat protein, partial [Kofleriaceae bacterium]|nr:tetratricopeptide repeat protein [Kofleriaceae bacterium]
MKALPWLALLGFCVVGPAEAAEAKSLSLVTVNSEPTIKGGKTVDVAALQALVEKEPDNRRARFELVRGLMSAKKLEEAKVAAIEWRKSDAYNLVVVRLLGDIYSELGDTKRAMRTYSAVVELLPKDHKAHRALASVLKQNGQLEAAKARLSAALEIRPDDSRLRFELADVVQRLGDYDRARSLFERIVDSEDTPELLRYPAKERLAQSYKRQRTRAQKAGKTV